MSTWGRDAFDTGDTDRFWVTLAAMVWLAFAGAAASQSSQPLLVLPIAISCLFLIACPVSRAWWHNPGLAVFLCVAGIRYLALPSLMLLVSNPVDLVLVTDRSILLMCYEEAVALAALAWIIRHRYPAGGTRRDVEIQPYRGVVPWLVVLAAAVCVSVFPAVLNDYHLVFDSGSVVVWQAASARLPGAVELATVWGRTLLPLLLIGSMVAKAGVGRRRTYVLSVLAILVFGVTVFTGVSRQSALVPGVAGAFYLGALFPWRRRQTWAIMFVGLALSFALMTAVKVQYIAANGGTVRPRSFASSLEPYFNGFSNLELAIRTGEIYGNRIDATTALNDALGNFPGARMNLSDRTTVFYNYVFYGGGPSQDQILPFAGQALLYFGYWFLWIPILGDILLIAAFDRRFRSAGDTVDAYLYALAAVVVGMAFTLNITIVLAHSYTLIVPGMLLVAVHKSRLRKSAATAVLTSVGDGEAGTTGSVKAAWSRMPKREGI